MGEEGLPSRTAAPRHLPWGSQDGASGGSGTSQATDSSAPARRAGRGLRTGLGAQHLPGSSPGMWGPRDVRLPSTRAPGHQTLLKINLLQNFPSPPGVWLYSRCVHNAPSTTRPHNSSLAGVTAWGGAHFPVSQSPRLENSPGCTSVRLIRQQGWGERGWEGSHIAFLWVKLFRSN